MVYSSLIALSSVLAAKNKPNESEAAVTSTGSESATYSGTNLFDLNIPLPIWMVAVLVLIPIGWYFAQRKQMERQIRAKRWDGRTPTTTLKEYFRFWSKGDRKTFAIKNFKVKVGQLLWATAAITFALAWVLPSLDVWLLGISAVCLITQVGRASADSKAQKATTARLYEVCSANLSWGRQVTAENASSYISVDEWDGSNPAAVTIRISAKDAGKKDSDRARFAAAFSAIMQGDKRWVFDWDNTQMTITGVAEDPLPEARQRHVNQIFSICKANLSWSMDTTIEAVDMYVDVVAWDENDNPLEVYIKIDPKDAKKSQNDRARFAYNFSQSMNDDFKWVFEWDLVNMYVRGIATPQPSPERQAMVNKMFDICKANLSWDNDTTVECADAYVKVNKWAGNEPADFDITISARDAKKKEEDRANFERIFSLAMSQDRRYVFDWFPNESRIHGTPTPPLPRMASLPALDKHVWNEFPLGIGAGGKEVFWDCKTYPHALVVGKTGSGKSVIQRNILVHALSQPDEWQVALIDPKRVELGGYRVLSTKDGQGGVISIALTLPEQVDLLEKVEAEMMRRYDAMESVGLNNAQNYVDPTTGRSPKAILLMVDEAYQLLAPESGSSDQIKENNEMHGRAAVSMGSIARLGRAAKVHMVVATQRPDAKVLGGELKSNLDCRIGCGTMDTIPSLMCFDDDSGTFITPVKGRAMIRQGGIPVEFQGYFFDSDKEDVNAHIRRGMVMRGQNLNELFPRLYSGEDGAPGFPLEQKDALLAEFDIPWENPYTEGVEIEDVTFDDVFARPTQREADFSRPNRTNRLDETPDEKKKRLKSGGKGEGILKKMYGKDYGS
jgi:hypothetical protein